MSDSAYCLVSYWAEYPVIYGGVIDNLIQRIIEILRSLPTIPLWMGLSAAIPLTWPPIRVYFAITVLLSLIGWTSLAREVRGRFLSLKTEDFVIAARLDGVREMQIILRHMVPSMTSHIIASVTLAIPGMILAETALSFLGIGLQAAGGQLGCAAAGGAECALYCYGSLADCSRALRSLSLFWL